LNLLNYLILDGYSLRPSDSVQLARPVCLGLLVGAESRA
jgi:hypothetical protein